MLTCHIRAFLTVERILEYGRGLVSGTENLDEANSKIIMELLEELIKMTVFNVGNQVHYCYHCYIYVRIYIYILYIHIFHLIKISFF